MHLETLFPVCGSVRIYTAQKLVVVDVHMIQGPSGCQHDELVNIDIWLKQTLSVTDDFYYDVTVAVFVWRVKRTMHAWHLH